MSEMSPRPNQEPLLDQTREWIGATDIRDALGDDPGAEVQHAAIVADRLEFIRTALGATLLDKYEEAQQSLEAGRAALGLLGIGVATPEDASAEEEPDKLFTVDALSYQLGGNKRRVSRMWGALERDCYSLKISAQNERNMPEADQRRHQLYGGLFVGARISLRGLKRLVAAQDVDLQEGVRNLGPIGMSMIREAASLEFDD